MMLDMDAKHSEPDAQTTAASDDLCPECRHEKTAAKSLGIANWLRVRVGMKPLAAVCATNVGIGDVYLEGGDDGPCGCRHPAHGSYTSS